jgi:Uma2 family endonuclease
VTAAKKTLPFENIAELMEQLGNIPTRRVRLEPPPGKATERDVIAIQNRTNRQFELVDGVLVEKAVGFLESTFACDLIALLKVFVDRHDLGFLAGEAGAVRLMPGLVRIPDVSFISWDQLPTKERPTGPIADLAPALTVEVLSEGNTQAEMDRKVREYFLSGTRLVWLVDANARTVQVYTAPDQSVVLTEDQALDGGDVLPGLSLPLRQVFAGAPQPKPGAKKGQRRRRPPRRKPG